MSEGNKLMFDMMMQNDILEIQIDGSIGSCIGFDDETLMGITKIVMNFMERS